jgi:hypothetical protein
VTLKYILAEDGRTPVEEPDLMKWARWFENSERQVAHDVVGAIQVSTVFLGFDHSFREIVGGEGPPVLWETMIFGGPADLDGYQDRYSSYGEAVAGHAKAMELARAAFAKVTK